MHAPSMVFTDTLWEWGTVDPDHSSGQGGWCIVVGIADGTTVIVGEVQEDEDPSQIYALTIAAAGEPVRVQIGGTVEPSAALPVAIRLDGGHGWVVAAYGSALAYRTTVEGVWTDAGTDAALLPEDATQVRVTHSGREVVVSIR